MEYENKQSKLFPYYKKLWHWGIKSLKVFVLIFTAFIIVSIKLIYIYIIINIQIMNIELNIDIILLQISLV